MMGSGKSVVGRATADRLELPFTDTDDVVVSRLGTSIPEFWEEHGEGAFRDVESSIVDEVAAGADCVVATGGGTILRESNVEQMRETGLVIWLQAGVQTLATRVRDSQRRPLLRDTDPETKLSDLLAERSHFYRAAAHATIATDDLEVATVVNRIEEFWNAY